MATEDIAEPKLEFDDPTPYERYVRASVLTSLQQPWSDDPAEMAFLITTQVMELWFALLVHEWRTAREALSKDCLTDALSALRRSRPQLRALNAAWAPIATLTPAQFNAYRSALGEGSGFQSAMYRHLEFLLGEKSAGLLQPHQGVPSVYDELTQALHTSSLYDEVLAYLARQGFEIPITVLDRDFSRRYEADAAVEAVWTVIYSDARHLALRELGEVLTDIAELVSRWRTDHLLATRRAMGSKQGTGGSAGVAWLEKRAARLVFPELWTARSHV
ncbi:MAG: tryptophan 2,3-dioxygenase [Kutzneria sp.]|nr:tryptophan 2,3-dioxygenase [Kutzneria sp.]MBV9847483.1 tryptophan 2,3-dioxygenase [Kutzneria sp.]